MHWHTRQLVRVGLKYFSSPEPNENSSLVDLRPELKSYALPLPLHCSTMSAPPPNHELSEGLQGEIIGMCKVKTSFAEKRYQETGSYTSAPCSGRPPKLTDRELRHIVRHIRHDRETRRQPLAEITKVLNMDISTRTIQRRFREIGLGH